MSFPDVSIPGMHSGVDYCIYRINRILDGFFQGLPPVTGYMCGGPPATQATRRFTSGLQLRVLSAPACDESATFLPTSLLIGRGNTILRADGFAHFFGSFQIVVPAIPVTPYYRGALELIGRSGSHQALGEACDEVRHIEGWIMGRGVGPADGLALHAALVARGTLGAGMNVLPDASVNRMTGTLIRSP